MLTPRASAENSREIFNNPTDLGIEIIEETGQYHFTISRGGKPEPKRLGGSGKTRFKNPGSALETLRRFLELVHSAGMEYYQDMEEFDQSKVLGGDLIRRIVEEFEQNPGKTEVWTGDLLASAT